MMRARGLAAARPLGVADRAKLTAEIVVAYVQARWALRRRGIRAALVSLRARPDGAAPGARPEAVRVGVRLGRAVQRTLRVLPADSRCLMSSLVLTRLLAARGIDTELVISVMPGEQFGAHAWIEHEGAPLLPPESPGQARLTTL